MGAGRPDGGWRPGPAGRRRRTAARAGSRIGLEADDVTWGAQRRWANTLAPSEPVATTGVVEFLSPLVKDAGGGRVSPAAAAIADAALGEVHVMLKNCTGPEEQVALALDTAMRRGGAEDHAFGTIVGLGANTAKPHRGQRHPIVSGDPVVIDFGATSTATART